MVVASVLMTSLCLKPLAVSGSSPLTKNHQAQDIEDVLGFLQRHEAKVAVVGGKMLQALPELVHAVNDEDPYVRFAVLWALDRIWVKGGGLYGEKEHLEIVEDCVQNPDGWWCGLLAERRRIVERWPAAVGAIDVPALVEAVVHALEDEDFWVQRQAIKTVDTIHEITPQSAASTDRMLRALLTHTTAPNPFIREAAYRALASWRDHPIVRNAPHTAHQDPTWLVRRVSRLRLDIVRQELRDLDPLIRENAILGLMQVAWGDGLQDTTFLREALLERVRDPHGAVSSAAVVSLMNLNDPQAIGPLVELWDFPHSVGKHTFEWALRNLSGKSIAELQAEFPVPPGRTPLSAAPVREKSPARLKHLYAVVETGSWVERLSALLELTWVAEPAAYAAINRGLEDPDARVRYAALDLLRLQVNRLWLEEGFRVYLENLYRALHDPNRHVVKAAIDLVQMMGISRPGRYDFEGKRSRFLEAIWEKTVQADDAFIRQAAIDALEEMSPERHRLPPSPE